jgi:hypothetical protein
MLPDFIDASNMRQSACPSIRKSLPPLSVDKSILLIEIKEQPAAPAGWPFSIPPKGAAAPLPGPG